MERFLEELDLLLGSFVLEQDAGCRIAGEEGREVLAASGDAAVQAPGFGRVFGFRLKQTFTEAFSVQRSNLEHAMAARRAAGVAEEMWAGTLGRGGESRIDDLDEGVRKRNHGKPKVTRSPKDVPRK